MDHLHVRTIARPCPSHSGDYVYRRRGRTRSVRSHTRHTLQGGWEFSFQKVVCSVDTVVSRFMTLCISELTSLTFHSIYTFITQLDVMCEYGQFCQTPWISDPWPLMPSVHLASVSLACVYLTLYESYVTLSLINNVFTRHPCLCKSLASLPLVDTFNTT